MQKPNADNIRTAPKGWWGSLKFGLVGGILLGAIVGFTLAVFDIENPLLTILRSTAIGAFVGGISVLTFPFAKKTRYEKGTLGRYDEN